MKTGRFWQILDGKMRSICVLTIEHHDGRDVSAHWTEEHMYAHLYTYIQKWWKESFKNVQILANGKTIITPAPPMSGNQRKDIDYYLANAMEDYIYVDWIELPE